MSPWRLLYLVMFCNSVCIEESRKHYGEGNKGEPYGFSLENSAENGRSRSAYDEERGEHPLYASAYLLTCLHRRPDFSSQLFYYRKTYLPDVIGAESRSHRYALRLPESIILHGADKIDSYLRYLMGRSFGQPPQYYYSYHFYEN